MIGVPAGPKRGSTTGALAARSAEESTALSTGETAPIHADSPALSCVLRRRFAHCSDYPARCHVGLQEPACAARLPYWLRAPRVTARTRRATMSPVSETESPVEARLKKALRRYRQLKPAREELHEAIKAMAAEGKRPKEITFLIDHEYDVNHVSRIINGRTNTRAKKPADS